MEKVEFVQVKNRELAQLRQQVSCVCVCVCVHVCLTTCSPECR